MAIDQAAIEILGLLVDVATPVESSYVPLPPGVTVLYGLNGAGKTRLLRTLQAALLGRPDLSTADCDLALRVRLSSEADTPSWVVDYLANWAERAEVVWTPSSVHREVDVDLYELARRAASDSLDEPEGYWSTDSFGPPLELEVLADEIAEQSLFLISPRSVEQSVVRLGAVASDTAPTITSAVVKWRATESAQADVDWDDRVGLGFDDPFKGSFAEIDLMGDLASNRPPFVAVWPSERDVRGIDVARVITDAAEGSDLTQALAALSRSGVKLLNKRGGLTQRAEQVLDALATLAQSLLDEVLLDAPHVKLNLGEPRDWFLGRPPTWGASPRATPDRNVTVGALSEAEGRWFRLATALATRVVQAGLEDGKPGGSDDRPLFVILDEPEAHLHRSAESHMATGLRKWADAFGAHVVVASHSPELLDLSTTHLLEVYRDSKLGASRVRKLTDPTRATMAELGLTPSDLLRRQRVFVLVEGTHDQIVLEELLGAELRNARAEVLPLRGAKQLPATVDSQFLFDFTDAHVVVMLDATDAAHVDRVWRETQERAAATGTERAGGYLRDSLPGNQPELRWMREFLSKSVEANIAGRLTPFGLEAMDVVEYLPVDVLVPGAHSWSELRSAHSSSGTRKDFKSWLVATRRANFAPDRIREAARAMDEVPTEFVRLLDLIGSLP